MSEKDHPMTKDPDTEPTNPEYPGRKIEEKEQLHPGPKHYGTAKPLVNLEEVLNNLSEQTELVCDGLSNDTLEVVDCAYLLSLSIAHTLQSLTQYLIEREREPKPPRQHNIGPSKTIMDKLVHAAVPSKE